MAYRKYASPVALAAALSCSAALAQQALPTIEVGGAPLRAASRPVTPARAAGAASGPARAPSAPDVAQPAASPIIAYAVPAATYTLSSKELEQTRQFDVGGALQRQVPGVIITDVAGNPYQPQIDFRGFVASPVSGTPQGLAVYQNGIRVNEAWGDAVNWDLIPNVAIDRLTVVTGNPLFGLNALGGAVTLDMKNGFTYKGFELDTRFGSWARRQATMQYGVRSGDFASYLAMEGAGDNGYRHFSGSDVKRLYGDVGYRGDSGEIHANVTVAQNRFGASGPAPVELTNIDTGAAYTTPQTYKNTLAMYDLNGNVTPNEHWKLFGDVHFRAFDQARTDGNATDFNSCGGGVLCNGDGDPTSLPDFFGGAASLGVIDYTWMDGGRRQQVGLLLRNPERRGLGCQSRNRFLFLRLQGQRQQNLAARYEVRTVDGEGNRSTLVVAESIAGDPETYTALGGFSPTQGANQWKYEEAFGDTAFIEMRWDCGGYEGGGWAQGWPRSDGCGCNRAAQSDVSRTLVAPANATLTVTGSIRKDPSAENGYTSKLAFCTTTGGYGRPTAGRKSCRTSRKRSNAGWRSLPVAPGDSVRFVLQHSGHLAPEAVIWNPTVVVSRRG